MRKLTLAIAVIAPMLGHAASAEDTLKIGYIDPLSGGGASVGEGGLKTFQYLADELNAKGGILGHKVEIVPLDNKTNPQESLVQAQKAIDAGVHYITQGNGSSVGAALSDFVTKNNTRNPGKEVLYFNYAAVDPSLTNEKCSYWHFRMDAHVGMKAETMVRALPKDVTKVYLLNQDYLFGQSVQRDIKTFLGKLRPDVKIVGDELIPLGKVKDFSPYVTKVKASGAQALITGNWGPDMTLLIKAGMDTGLDIRYYTMYAHLGGGATAIGPAGNGKVRSVMAFHENIAVETGKTDTEGWTKQFRSQHDYDFYAAGFRTIFEFLQAAMNKAGSADPLKFAQALEGLTITDMLGHQVTMRKPDHQILSEYFVGVFTKGVKYDSEKTGLGWKTETTVLPKDLDQPNTCNMKRPTS